MPLLRTLMTQVVAGMFGPDYPGTILDADAPRPSTSKLSDLQLVTEWECSAVTDKENGFDFGAGYWKDRHGREGRGTIFVFEDVFDQIEVFHAFKFYLVRGVGDAEGLREMNPRVIRFDIVEEERRENPAEERKLEDSELVFEVKEYTETRRSRCINPVVAWAMDLNK
jgi:hypothetical protein